MDPLEVAREVGTGLLLIVMLVAGIDFGIGFLMGGSRQAVPDRDG